ncbi:DNA adenine methylase [Paenibacillus sp. FSL L8-0709]|uniref:DNA adenine methylase n=1 Tax=Paenibacillus sp. FSL L8-0709 TaxID=2975312 RepID=UPI0030F9B2F3
MNMKKTDKLVSPYIGGGSVEFALLEAGVFKELVINDYDFGVYSLFELIKRFPEALTLEIKNRALTHEDFKKAREIIKADYVNCDMFEAAWSLIVVNRLAYSGIYKANPLGGIRGTKDQMLSRWNPEDLCNRISKINSLADRFTVQNIDALEFIEEQYWEDKATILIDPPYYKQGKNLYLHYYTEEDHVSLQQLLESLYMGFPCADLLVTYDDVSFIESIYNYPDIKRIKRKFSA